MNREGWESAGALCELQEYSPVENLVSTTVCSPPTPTSIGWVGTLLGCFGLPAISPQSISSYIARSLLPLNNRSKQEKQSTTTCSGLSVEWLQPGGPVPQVPKPLAQLQPASQLPEHKNLDRRHFYTRSLSLQQTRKTV